MTFLQVDHIQEIERKYDTPVYVYSEEKLLESVDNFLSFPSAFWHTVRYAMKANSNKNILKIFEANSIKIDCSSEYEVYRVLAAWYDWKDLQLSGQETPRDLKDLLEKEVFFVATSLHQIEAVWKLWLVKNIGVRINPWTGDGAFKAISTWWKTSAFGIWYEYTDKIKELAKKYNLKITKIHIHIGSENTPESWTKSASTGLDLVEKFSDVDTLDMWGGFKKSIIYYEKSADLQAIWKSVSEKFYDFYEKTGRKIHLEVEPGKYMVINSCSILAKINDIVDTWKDWYKFIRTNTGMTEMPRVSMYWIQQPIDVINNSIEKEKYAVVWHCCESWDLLTCKLYEQETIEEIELPRVSIWDTIVISWVWAYSSSMSMKNYNSFPEAGEIMLMKNWKILEIRKRQKLEDIWKNEIEIF